MTTDPGQQIDVADSHPLVVTELKQAYEKWWTDISKDFGQPTAIHIGSQRAPVVSLTSHDWLGDNAKVPWQQRQIRQAMREKDGIHKGFWHLDVKSKGQYNFKLSRWPLEANTAIVSPMAKGRPVPGQAGFRETKGVAFPAVSAQLNIAGQSLSKAVGKFDQYVEFSLKLPAGKTQLMASFVDDKNNQLGAYYVQVEKKAD